MLRLQYNLTASYLYTQHKNKQLRNEEEENLSDFMCVSLSVYVSVGY